MMEKTMEKVFSEVFGTSQGRTMLYWIANECGWFQGDPRKISPELLAFFNRMLRVGGVSDPRKAGALMESLMAVANKPVREERSTEYDELMAFLDE